MFPKRSEQLELMDDLCLGTAELRKNLDELVMLNRLVGSKTVLLSALNKVYKRHRHYFHANKIVIADLGCGGGDLLRAINDWAATKKIDVELVGIDANPFMINYATEKSNCYPNISFKSLDIWSSDFLKLKVDIVCINSFCHHLSNEELIKLWQQLTKQASMAIIINDLQRHWLSYFTVKWFAKLFRFSSLAQHDGPLSVLRAFRKQELIKLLQLANIHAYQIRWAWAFRWEIIIWSYYDYKN